MKELIRKFLQRYGYDIIKLRPEFKTGKIDFLSLLAEYKWLNDYNFKAIIDIGANEGQFSEKMLLLFPGCKLFAFEPIPFVYEKLIKNFEKYPNFKAINLALGEADGELEFYTNEYSPSSSALPMAKKHVENFNHAVATQKIMLGVSTLDGQMKNEELPLPLLIKIDVQGFEDKVIKGGVATLKQASAIITEVSFETLYENQPLFHSVYSQLHELGFRYAGNIEQLYSPHNHKILQADALFIKQ